MTATMTMELERPSIGEMAPRFSLPSLSGAEVNLASYRGRSNVVVWFSRGFTCPFCRVYTDGVRAGCRYRGDPGGAQSSGERQEVLRSVDLAVPVRLRSRQAALRRVRPR